MVDPTLTLSASLPPVGEYVRIPFVDPSTGLYAVLVAAPAQTNTWGALQTIQIPYAETRAIALLVQAVGTFQGLTYRDVPAGLLLTIDSCVNDGGIEMIHAPQLVWLEPAVLSNHGAFGNLGWFSAENLIVLFRDDPHLLVDMTVKISGRLLLPQGAPLSGETCNVGLVVELIADALYDPIPEAIAALQILQRIKLDTHDQRPTAKLEEIMRRSGVI